MKKLIDINNRKSVNSLKPNWSLPVLKKNREIPLFEEENNIIARKLIHSKPSVSTF